MDRQQIHLEKALRMRLRKKIIHQEAAVQGERVSPETPHREEAALGAEVQEEGTQTSSTTPNSKAPAPIMTYKKISVSSAVFGALVLLWAYPEPELACPCPLLPVPDGALV